MKYVLLNKLSSSCGRYAWNVAGAIQFHILDGGLLDLPVEIRADKSYRVTCCWSNQ